MHYNSYNNDNDNNNNNTHLTDERRKLINKKDCKFILLIINELIKQTIN